MKPHRGFHEWSGLGLLQGDCTNLIISFVAISHHYKKILYESAVTTLRS
jgi:hypothetical protein